jgi:hypothetical protein
MSGWLEHAARRLAASESVPSPPPTAGSWSEGLTRRDALGRAAGAGLALGAVTTLGPWVASAEADDYCLAKCIKNADSDLADASDYSRARVLKSYLTTAIPLFRLTFLAVEAVNTVNHYGDYYAARSRCRDPNCGDPKTYPPGGSPPPPPNPPGCGNDAQYVSCGDQPCCNLSFAVCVNCARGPVCCSKTGNCCG